jgi:hypothetical protein
MLQQVDPVMAQSLDATAIRRIVDLVPDSWLAAEDAGADPAALRGGYAAYLTDRLQHPRPFLDEALRAR